MPDSINPAAQDFIRRIGQEIVKSTIDQIHSDIRTQFNYRRKEMIYCCEEGFGSLKTPAFDLQIQIDQCQDISKSYCLTTAITALHQTDIANDPAFHSCFTHHCDHLVVEPNRLIDVEEKIDALEAIPELQDQLTYEPDGSACQLQLKELDLRIEINESEIVFSLLTLKNLEKLLHHSQQAFEILITAGLNPHLP